ncbi:MAG: TonB-dependent receptor plug domain-containing protein [Bacteroidaceae bacterium]|nr:TonB-dependent receptor plug domain-containing protein [Bacteroidaceae bacterium]
MNRLQFFENIRGAMLALLLLVGVALVPAGAFATAGTDASADPDDLNVATGVVVDKKTGEPLISVNVAVWANGRLLTGTSTDFEGKFKIISPVIDFELRVSYVGYNEAKFSSKNGALHDLRVELSEESSTLTEVVVTGFVSKNKETFTGSATEISGVELRQVSGTNLISAISALTPGMAMVQNTSQGSNPNHTPELVLRGMSSFSNSGQQVNQPTIILDGTEITMQDLYDLDINEIENITVLKDASATALYGSKAANGVIVITRKPIQESTLRVQYNFTGNFQLPVLSDYNVLSAAEKLEYERLAGLYDAKGEINATTGLPLQYEYDELYNQRYKLIAAG